MAWRGGPLDLSNERHVKSFWTGTVREGTSETIVKKRDESIHLVKSASLIWRISNYEEQNIDYIHCHREKLDDVKTLFSITNQREINQLISDWNKEEESKTLFPEHEEFLAEVYQEEFNSCERNQPHDIDEDLFPEHEEFSSAIRQDFGPCERNHSRDEDEDLFPKHDEFSAAIREEESQGRLTF